MEQDKDDPAADMEMTSNEAAAYLSGPVGFTLTAKLVRGLRYLDKGPVVEKRTTGSSTASLRLTPSWLNTAPTPTCGRRVAGGRLLSSCAGPETQALSI
jgi:hypothetical protein